MRTIEELASLFASIPMAVGDRWSVETLAQDRLHLSRGPAGEFAVFLEGSRESFGALPDVAGIEHSGAVTVVPIGRQAAALRITTGDPTFGNRIMAHIAYEVARRLEAAPRAENRQLLDAIGWVLPLLGADDAGLSVEKQFGLIGECLVLQRMLALSARHGMAGWEALRRWKGASVARRDFASHGVAIEVKATGHVTRLHHIGSIEQLDPQSATEEVFLCSVGLRRDHSAPKKLPDYVADVEASLKTAVGDRDDSAIAAFGVQLRGYGYDRAREAFYRTQPGFRPPHLSLALYAESRLDRLRLSSLKNDRLPTMVVGVGYTIELQGVGLSTDETDAVLMRLLKAPAVE